MAAHGVLQRNCEMNLQLNHTDSVPTCTLSDKTSPSHYFSLSYPSFATPLALLLPLPIYNLHSPILLQDFCLPQGLVYAFEMPTHPKMANMETTSEGKIFCENFWDTMNLIHQITVYNHTQPRDSGDSQSRQSSPTDPILLKKYIVRYELL
jgi:hypothetical protein